MLIVRLERRLVGLNGPADGLFHLVDRQANRDAKLFDPTVQTFQVLAEQELLLVERACHLEHHVAKHKCRVENRDFGLSFCHILAVHVYQALCLLLHCLLHLCWFS